MSNTLKAHVRVKLVVDVYVANWETSSSFDHVHSQAEREARKKLNDAISRSNSLNNTQMVITQDPGVLFITLSQE